MFVYVCWGKMTINLTSLVIRKYSDFSYFYGDIYMRMYIV